MKVLELIYGILNLRLSFIKKIYKTRHSERNSLAETLSIISLAINIHSIIILLEFYMNFDLGLMSFWNKESSTPKSGYGYIFGALFFIFYYILLALLRKLIPIEKRYKVLRIVLNNTPNRWLSVFYIVLTIGLFFFGIAIIGLKQIGMI